MDPHHIADHFINAPFEPGRMGCALDGLAKLAEADGAVLVHRRGDRQLPPICTASMNQFVTDYLGSDHPPDPRVALVNPTMAENFRVDHDDFSDDKISHDPFYQEFLRPRGVGWHACALLTRSLDADIIYLSFKRDLAAGPFTQDKLSLASAMLPMLRAAAASGVNAQVRGDFSDVMAGAAARFVYRLHNRRDATLANATAVANPVLGVRDGVLHAPDRINQARVADTIALAFARAAPAAVLLHEADGARWSMRVIPAAPSVQAAAMDGEAWVILSQLDVKQPHSAEMFLSVMADLFHLSKAEARIAYWVARGEPLDAIAHRFSTKTGTVRNQLKSIFQKTGVTRQTELVALVARL
jgi:DNA-binding CsgD family transcriptional regulator